MTLWQSLTILFMTQWTLVIVLIWVASAIRGASHANYSDD